MEDEIVEVEQMTITSQEQDDCENSVSNEKAYTKYVIKHGVLSYSFNREVHVKFAAFTIFKSLPKSFEGLSASMGWMLYYTTNVLRIYNKDLIDYDDQLVESLDLIARPNGVYRGYQSAIPILAGVYSGVCAMCCIGSEGAYNTVDRKNTYDFIMSRKFPNGSFEMNEDSGDIDTRAAFCAISSAYVLNILDEKLIENVAEWVLSCQTYEGGFAGMPGGEAHGGYTYCAVACLALLGRVDEIDIESLLRWLIYRQKVNEGGFDGRINKLVDVCYTFWQGAVFGILHKYSKKFNESPLFPNIEKLLEYVILASQCKDGGFRDKPSKKPDYYHTNYALTGMSILLHAMDHKMKNELKPVEPAMGVQQSYFDKAVEYFKQLPSIH